MIDAVVFHDWSTIKALTPYMPLAFRQWVERPSDPFGAVPLRTLSLYPDPRAAKASAFDFDALVSRMDSGGWDRVVLGYQDALLATNWPNQYVAGSVVSAANDWTTERWLERDQRLFGLILVSSALPEAAAAEIRRVGVNDRMVGVALGVNALCRPFGDPIYHPIYRAATELDLPVVIQVGSDEASGLNSLPVAGGLPSTFAEYHALCAHSNMSHSASLILQGAFELFPNLRVLMVGGGVMWVPGFLWRLDYWYKMSPTEAPWLRSLPSTYFMKHIRMATYQIEAPSEPERLGRALATVPSIEKILMYGGGFPSPDTEEPAAVAARLPAGWHDGVFKENASRFFRWPRTGTPVARRAGRNERDRPVPKEAKLPLKRQGRS